MLKTGSDANLLRFIKYGPSAFILLIGTLFAYFTYIEHRAMLSQEIFRTTEAHTTLHKTRILEQVDRVMERLKREQARLQSRLQQLTKADVNYGIRLANKIIAKHQGESRSAVEEAVLEALQHARLRTEHGYFIINDTNGIGILNKHFPNFHGRNLMNFKDGKGRYLFRDILHHLKHHEDMFIDWSWRKPGSANDLKQKVGYFAKIDALGWIIGTGTYLEDYRAQVQNRLLKDIENVRFGRNGYIAVLDLHGRFLAHRKNSYLGKTVMETNDIQDATAKWREALQIARSGGGFASAVHSAKPDSTTPTQKHYYLKRFPAWGWIICTGFYQDDMKDTLQPRLDFLNERYEAYIRNIWVYCLLITSSVLLASLALSRRLGKTFQTYRDKLEHLSNSDKLTGLSNRLKLDSTLEYEHKKFLRYGVDLSIIMLDIDHFKRINDSYGHQVGDQVLVSFANVLQNNKRETDLIGRWGGEEFLIICPHTNSEDAIVVANRYRQAVEYNTFPHAKSVTASFGISTFSANDSVESAVKRADAALYQAKSHGRNQVVLGLGQH